MSNVVIVGKRTNTAKVEFYRVTISTVMGLIEERSGRKIHTLDANIERKVENAIEYGNVKELKDLLTALDEMYTSVKKRALLTCMQGTYT